MGNVIHRFWLYTLFLESKHNWLNYNMETISETNLPGSFKEAIILLVLRALEKNLLPPIKKKGRGFLFWFEGACKLRFGMAVLNTTAVPCLSSGEGGILTFCTSVEGWEEDVRCHIYIYAY